MLGGPPLAKIQAMLLALLLLATPSPVRDALVQGQLQDAALAAASQAARDPSQLRCAAALANAVGDYKTAAAMLKKAPPLPSTAAPAAPAIALKPGAVVYVLASTLTLRAQPLPGAKPVVSLPIATRLEVLGAQGAYLQVRAPLSAEPSRVIDLIEQKSYRRTPAQAEGWLAAAFVGMAPPDPRALEKQDDLSALERLAALDLSDRARLAKLAGLAYDAGDCGVAGWASGVLAGTAAPLDGWDVEFVQPLFGCRGDVSQAQFVAPRRKDVLAGKAPANACAIEPPPTEPCPACEAEGSSDASQAAQVQKAIAAAEAYREKFESLFSSDSALRVRLRRRAGPAGPVFAFSASYSMSCGNMEPMGATGIEVRAIPLPADARTGELVEVFVPAHGFAGLVAAPDADAARAAAAAYRNEQRKVTAPMRALQLPSGPDCCCD